MPPGTTLTWPQRARIGRDEVTSILRRIWPYLLVGIGLGAAMHGRAPEALFIRYAGSSHHMGEVVFSPEDRAASAIRSS